MPAARTTSEIVAIVWRSTSWVNGTDTTAVKIGIAIAEGRISRESENGQLDLSRRTLQRETCFATWELERRRAQESAAGGPRGMSGRALACRSCRDYFARAPSSAQVGHCFSCSHRRTP